MWRRRRGGSSVDLRRQRAAPHACVVALSGGRGRQGDHARAGGRGQELRAAAAGASLRGVVDEALRVEFAQPFQGERRPGESCAADDHRFEATYYAQILNHHADRALARNGNHNTPDTNDDPF